jgi:nucleoside-diphosphate-sugar epimerase
MTGTPATSRLLVVGGSGYVGRLLLPLLARHHHLRVLDLVPPAGDWDHVIADATDPAALARAMEGVDLVVHAAMSDPDGNERASIRSAFDVNVTSVHLTLAAAHRAGITHAVYLSSLSVYRDLLTRRLDDESVPPDATDLYGLTKRLGEETCRAAVAELGISVNVLRLAWPTPDAVWPAWGLLDPPERLAAADGTLFQATAASDLASAVLAALAHRDGFQIFTISGDQSVGLWSIAKARQRLGWAPTFGGLRP